MTRRTQPIDSLLSALPSGSIGEGCNEVPYDVVARNMLMDAHRFPLWDDTSTNFRADMSFSAQMQLVTERQSDDPALYFVTANSAVPAADALRGYHEASSLPEPAVEVIYANRRMTEGPLEQREERKSQEAARLSQRLADLYPDGEIPNVYVIDQFIDSGRTLDTAVELIDAAGATDIRRIRGRWWYDAQPSEVDVEAVTSIHAGLMRQVGHIAAGLKYENLSGLFD